MQQVLATVPFLVLAASLACAPATSAADRERTSQSPPGTAARTSVDFEWEGSIADGGTFELKNVEGDVDVVVATGKKVRVRAVKSGKDANRVEIEVVERKGGIVVKPKYPKRGANARIDFTIELPASVALEAKLVNGDVDVKSAGSPLKLETVSGDIHAAGSDDVSVKTVEGNAVVALGSSARHAQLGTVNGKLEVRLPDALGFEVNASTLNGKILSEYPADHANEMVGSKASLVHGDRAAKIHMKSVNGRIAIKKS